MDETPPPTVAKDADALRRALIRNFDDAPKALEQRAPLYESLCARLGEGTAAKKLGISIDVVAPGMRSCPYHFHYAREEAFVVLEGEGTLRVAGEKLALRAGDIAFIPPGPDFPHQIINTSGAPLKYLSIGTLDSPEVVVYPDSDKYLAMAREEAGTRHFGAMHRSTDDLDYWDGEP